MKAKIIATLIYLLLIGFLAYGIYQPESGLSNIAIGFVWVTMLATTTISIFMMIMATVADSQKGSQREETINGLIKAFGLDKKSLTGKILGWCRLALILSLMAYTGWIFTTVMYFSIAMLFLFAKVCAQDSVDKYHATLR